MNTKTPTKLLSLVAASSLAVSASFAQDNAVTSDVVGYVTKTLNPNSDLKMAVPMTQSVVLATTATSVASGAITVPATVSDITTDTHFVHVTSGTLAGNWYTVTGYTSFTITVAEDLEAAGLLTAVDPDTSEPVVVNLQVLPFWTLDTLFPSGGDIPQSSDVTSPVAQVLINNVNSIGINITPTSSYIYHSGEQGPAGWYDLNNIGGGLQGSAVVSPESFITIRNDTSSEEKIIVAGSVMSETFANNILSRSAGQQDNLLPNPYPAGIKLKDSNLVATGVIRPSTDVTAPLDQLLVYDVSPTGTNPTPTISIIYHSGEQGPAGWYNLNNIGGGTIDTYEIPAGSAFIVRRAIGSDEVVAWKPATPYNL